MQNLDVKETIQKIKKTKEEVKKEFEESIAKSRRNENADYFSFIASNLQPQCDKISASLLPASHQNPFIKHLYLLTQELFNLSTASFLLILHKIQLQSTPFGFNIAMIFNS